MSDIDLESRIRSAYSNDDASPPAGGIEAVRARRAAGERGGTLPSVVRRPALTRWIVVGIAAAALVIAMLYPRNGSSPAPVAPAPARAPAAADLFLPDPLMAQATRTPSYPVVDEPLGLRLKPGRWFYAYSRDTGATVSTDTLTISEIERAEHDGKPAWQFVGGRAPADGPSLYRDTVWTTRDSLRILARVVQIGPGERLEETYGDSAVLRGETHGGFTAWRSRPIRNPHGPDGNGVTIRWYQFAAALQTAKLSSGWKASIEFQGLIEDRERTRDYLNIAVIGEESVTVRAGRFDCWKVGVGGSSGFELNGLVFWVSKDRGWIVAQRSVRGGAITTNVELVRFEELR